MTQITIFVIPSIYLPVAFLSVVQTQEMCEIDEMKLFSFVRAQVIVNPNIIC